jgi:predicted small secreted protein
MNRIIPIILLVVGVVLIVFAISAMGFNGCQTTEGVGRDIENLGESIQN